MSDYATLLRKLKSDEPLDDADRVLLRREIVLAGGAGLTEYTMKRMGEERQVRVRDSLRSHGPWGGER